jgi:chitodextrinase
MALAAAVGVSTVSGAAAGSSTTVIFRAAADAFTSSASPSTNFGAQPFLVVDEAPDNSTNGHVFDTYLKFDVEGLTAPVAQATLRLYVLNGDTSGFDVRGVADDSWVESEITWENAPASASDDVGSSGGFAAGQWVSVDVTPLVSGNGLVSMELQSTSTVSPMAFASREIVAWLTPQLVVKTSAVPPVDQTPPTVAGTAEVGDTLAATTGTWTGTEPIAFAYKWQRCDAGGDNCTDIPAATGSTYRIDSADAGSTLRVAVTASNPSGSSTATSASTAVVAAPPPVDTSPPSAPSNLSLTATTTATISLSWSASSDNVGVAGYDVYLNGSKVDTTAQTSYGFGGLACGTDYTLGVVAYDAAGNRSAESTLTGATAACADTSPPSAPSNLSLTATTAATISLSWSASSDNVGVAGYDVYLNGSKVDTTAQTSYGFSGLACGTDYTLGIVAYDAAGNRSAESTLTGATAACPTTFGPCGTPTTAVWQHVIWIVFENKQYSQVIGSADAPYINSIARQCGLATNFTAEAHPSLPNYIAMTSGSTQAITDDSGPSSHPLAVASIFSQLGSGGWRSLEESMPANCDVSDSGFYAVRHNPAAYYTNIRSDCAANDVPLGASPDLSAGFTFVTPDTCHDMHSSSCGSDTSTEVKNGDTWLANFLPKVLASPGYQAGTTAVFVTWDEDDHSDSQHVPTLVIAPSVPAGATSATAFNHYSMLRATEEMLGLTTFLGDAATATSMRSAFHL